MASVSQSPHTPCWNSWKGMLHTPPAGVPPTAPAARPDMPRLIWMARRSTPAISRVYRSRFTSFRLAKRPPSQLSRNPASRDSVVGSSARKGTPITSRRTSSAPPPPPNQIRAAPAGRTSRAQTSRFSVYRAASLLSSTVKAGTGMDSSRSASLPLNTTPWAAKAVNIRPRMTAMPGSITSSRSSAPAWASCEPRAKLYMQEI